MPVGGIRISREAGTTVRTASYLPTDCAVFCRFLSSRKVSASRQVLPGIPSCEVLRKSRIAIFPVVLHRHRRQLPPWAHT